MKISTRERVLGCLLGGACGDALGAPFEFSSHAEMIIKCGPRGVQEFWPRYETLARVTDETQLILFTVAGLIESRRDKSLSEVEHLHVAYLAWLSTQGIASPLLPDFQNSYEALIDVIAAHGDRVPNAETMAALSEAKELGRSAGIVAPGNGAVARAAPFGLLYSATPQRAYHAAVADARLTHDDPRGYIAAGAFAMMIAWVMKGHTIAMAVERSLMFLRLQSGHEPTLHAVMNAPWKWSDFFQRPEWIGFGWTADDALAITVNAVLTTNSLHDAVAAAANHNGDSDTTASMAGNLAGALYGARAVPGQWLEKVELRKEIISSARLLCSYIAECSRCFSHDELHPGI
ncbi:ADP-ribosylglycohydrolase family protein [Devosia naphthalenivorans]|uniref:ADP-ribosylglycohydrolase family protein n=1 Tax=Devosia naphthalenivorans TaxID=2082392 RepID=UPI000D35B370|nr:ADP-ribosylglycohydrolase family protein [Devosia naphthalenivorans]